MDSRARLVGREGRVCARDSLPRGRGGLDVCQGFAASGRSGLQGPFHSDVPRFWQLRNLKAAEEGT